MSTLMRPTTRLLASVIVAATLVLASLVPALAYNEENVKHIQLSSSEIRCDEPITITAHLVDKEGEDVAGASVIFTLKKGETGDTLTQLDAFSDTDGNAKAELQLNGTTGNRIVQVSVPNDGHAQIVINAKKDDRGCTKPKGGGGGGGGGQGGVGGVVGFPTLPPTSTSTSIENASAVVAQVVPVVGILTLTGLGALVVAFRLRRRGSF
jgi:hypothetical protein